MQTNRVVSAIAGCATITCILLINGNPLDEISPLIKPDENFVVIMKDGKIFKNTLK